MRPPSSTIERDTRAGVAVLANHQVGGERAALEHGVRRVDAPDLDVLAELLGAEPDGEHRNRLRAQREQLVADRRARVVGAVGEHDEPGQRNAVELLARLLDRAAEMRLARVERDVAQRCRCAARSTRTGRGAR